MIKIINKKIVIIFLIIIAVIGIAYFVTRGKEQVAVISTKPSDNETNAAETSQIEINFNQNIANNSRAGVTVSFDPGFEFDSTWLTNTYKIIPKKALQNNQKYTATVSFKNKEIYRFSFETSVFSLADIQKYGKLQSQDDYEFGQALKKVVEQYPWYTSLPIETANYVIYYDFDQQKFAITFLVEVQDQKQKDALIQDALAQIKKLGVKDPVPYYINTPSNP